MSDSETREQLRSLRGSLKKAKAAILLQQKKLQQLTSPPLSYATVVAVNRPPEPKPRYQWREYYDNYRGGYRRRKVMVKPKAKKGVEARTLTATIVSDGKFFEVLFPEDHKAKPGNAVTIVTETMQIVEVAPTQLASGIAFVRRVIDTMFSEVDYETGIKVVFNGDFGKNIERGDRVVLDSTATVIVRNLGKEAERFSFTAETNVTWNEIGGLTEAKKQMIEAVELPHTNPDIFKFYGKRPVKGILLYGPPGCGKTMLGKATATALARIYNGGTKSAGFIYIKGPEILDRYVGVAEATVRQIFQRARKHKEKHGYPAVVFIDEADAILAKRGSGISSDVERTIVPMFLTEMDGLENSGALVILATNRQDILDPAVVRDGRIDRKIKIDRPTQKSAVDIFMLNLKDVPLNNGYSHRDLAELGSDELFSPRRVLYQIRKNGDETIDFTLGHLVNGGMIVGVVDQATSIALQRDLSKRRSRKRGLCKEDIIAAVDSVERQNRDLNHTDELAEFVHDFREDVAGIQRIRQGKG